MTLIEIEASGDYGAMDVHWYSPAPDDAVFIQQRETETGIRHLMCADREQARKLRDALNAYLTSLPQARDKPDIQAPK